MLGGDGENFVAEFVELRGEFGLARDVHFIYGDDGRLSGAAHEQREFLIEWRGADTAIDDLHDARGILMAKPAWRKISPGFRLCLPGRCRRCPQFRSASLPRWRTRRMRSRVMPGSLVTMERRVPVRRLKRVDLPTLGRPTMTIEGCADCAGFAVCGVGLAGVEA